MFFEHVHQILKDHENQNCRTQRPIDKIDSTMT